MLDGSARTDHPFAVQFNVTEADFIAWARNESYDGDGLETRRSAARREYARQLAVASAAAIIGVLGLAGIVPPAIMAVPLLGLAIVIGWRALRAVRTLTTAEAERTLAKWAAYDQTQQHVLGEYRIEVRESGLIIDAPHRREEHDWLSVTQVRQTPEYILLCFARSGSHFIPARAFAGDADRHAFVDAIRRHVDAAAGD